MASRSWLCLSPAVSRAVSSSRRRPEVEASAVAADWAAWGAGEVLSAPAATTGAGEALVAAETSAGATAAAGASVGAGCAAAVGAAVSAASAEDGGGGASSPRVASVKVSMRAITAPRVWKRLRCFMGGRGLIGVGKEGLAVSIQIGGSALARDSEETIARERASYTVT